MTYFIYFLKNNNNKFYIGQTNNLESRINQHLKKDWKAAKYTKDNDEFKLVFIESYQTRLEAMKREKQLKGWTRAKKEALINGDLLKLKALSRKANR